MTHVYVGYDKYGVEGVDEDFIQFVFDVVIGVTKLHPESEAGIVVTDDEQMKKLNKQYRNKDQATNVLSFGYAETAKDAALPADDKNYLGDIYISHSMVTAEAKEMDIKPKQRFTQLFVHGLLHLVGMHHDNEKQAQKMEDLEDQILTLIMDAE